MFLITYLLFLNVLYGSFFTVLSLLFFTVLSLLFFLYFSLLFLLYCSLLFFTVLYCSLLFFTVLLMFLIVLLILWNSSTIDCFFYCFVFTQDYLDRERFIHKRFTRLPTHSCHAMIVCGTINRSQKYKFGNLEIWKFGNLEIWKLKNKGSEKNKPSIFPPLFPNSSESGMVNLNKKSLPLHGTPHVDNNYLNVL